MLRGRLHVVTAVACIVAGAAGAYAGVDEEAQAQLVFFVPAVQLTVPATGDTVPTNARMVVVGDHFESASFSPTRVDDAGTFEPLAHTVLARSMLIALGRLDPGTTPIVELGCDECRANGAAANDDGSLGDVAFTVGDDDDTTAPAFTAQDVSLTATAFRQGPFGPPDGYFIGVDAPPVDDDSPAFIEAVIPNLNGGEPVARVVPGARTVLTLQTDARPRTICPLVLATDVAGNTTELGDADHRPCVDLADVAAPGCSAATPSATAPVVALLASLLLRIGRRRRRHNEPRAPHRADVGVVGGIVVGVMVVVLGAGAARAELDVDPAATRIEFTAPAAGDRIPTNAALVVVGDNLSRLDPVRTDPGSNGQPLATTEEPRRLVVDLGALVAGNPVVVDLGCASACTADALGFTVGDGPDATPPVFADAQVGAKATPTAADGVTVDGYDVAFDVPAIADDSPAFAEVELDGVAPAAGQATPGAGAHVTVHVAGADERTICGRVRAVDVAGNRTELDDDACVALKAGERGGCSSASLDDASIVGALVLALLCRSSIRRTGARRVA